VAQFLDIFLSMCTDLVQYSVLLLLFNGNFHVFPMPSANDENGKHATTKCGYHS